MSLLKNAKKKKKIVNFFADILVTCYKCVTSYLSKEKSWKMIREIEKKPLILTPISISKSAVMCIGYLLHHCGKLAQTAEREPSQQDLR